METAVRETNASPSPKLQSVYEDGPLRVRLFGVHSSGLSGPRRSGSNNREHVWTRRGGALPFDELELAGDEPPRPLLIAAPEESGTYPVVLFQHGFALKNSFYSQLLKQVASHGFVAVAPQMYGCLAGADATGEVQTAAEVIDWTSSGLSQALYKDGDASVVPEVSKLAVVGHSRGGKVVFGLATGVSKTSLRISAVAGLDPVDGMSATNQTLPRILQLKPRGIRLECPALIIGTGLGGMKKNCLFPPVAPVGVNHDAFYGEMDSPAFHLVASEHGHMDFVDDHVGGVQGCVSSYVCKNGPSREPMRRFTAGVLVAFLEASLKQDNSRLSAIFSNPSQAPVKLDVPKTNAAL